MRRKVSTLCSFLFVFQASVVLAQDLPSPEQFFGYQMGAEGKIINYFRGLEYYKLLAERSNRIVYQELGKTTNGNPFVLLIISTPENLTRLEDLKAARDRLSDPRKISEGEAMRLVESLPAVGFHTSSIHTTEISTAQVIPEFVYLLVSGKSGMAENVLDNIIVLVTPSANPDGQVMIKDWYDEHIGKPWEAQMPWLYHPYVGHDNNRDWILLHFPEQRLTATKVHNAWHPIYSFEMHQMGSSGARIFVPPYKDPHDPNTAPQVVETISMIGMAISHRLTAEGKAGVVKNAIFDLFTPARAYQVNHGTGRILTETASANFARAIELKDEDLQGRRFGASRYDPKRASWNFPLPWKAGRWSFRDMVEYQLSANLEAVELVATHSGFFNKAYYMALKRACEGDGWPYAFVVPPEQHDPGTAAELLQALQHGEVEVHRATAPFEADGHRFASGSYVIILRQPYAAWAKTILEAQDYPDLRASPTDPPIMPYDTTAHTLPLLLGVEAVEVDEPFEAELELENDEIIFGGTVGRAGRYGFAILPEANDAYEVADALLDNGYQAARLERELRMGGVQLSAGSFIISPGRGLSETLNQLASLNYFEAVALERNLPAGVELRKLHDPRIGLYEPWGGNSDAGWTRLVFENYGFEYSIVRNNDFKGEALGERFDVIIFPDGLSAERILEGRADWPEEYTGGIGKEGKNTLRRFLEDGGSVIAFSGTSMAIVELLELPIRNKLEGLSPLQHFCPGSIVLAEIASGSPLAYGLPKKLAVMHVWGPAFVPSATPSSGPEMAVSYPSYDPRLSGFLLGPEHLQGAGALAVQQVGKGRVILFAFRPQFRAMTHGAYKLLFNALFWACQSEQ